MARTSPEQRLATYERRYRELAAQLADLGMISTGSLTRRYTRCTSPGCKCRADPPQPPGPKGPWPRNIHRQTGTRRHTPAEAKLYPRWIANDRRMRRIIDQMHTIAAKATDIHLTQATSQDPKV